MKSLMFLLTLLYLLLLTVARLTHGADATLTQQNHPEPEKSHNGLHPGMRGKLQQDLLS
ncbi:MAG: hypothetical protein RL654_1025 [Pseudomonadota bacterium]|jgi:hypothetical protein